MNHNDKMFKEDWWLSEDQQWKNRQNINPPNFMNIDEAIAFMHNNNLEMQRKILEKLEKIEKMLEEK